MPTRKHPKADSASAAKNRPEALRLYIAGHTFKQIAEALGVSVSTAHGYIKSSLQEAAKERQDLAEAELEAQVERLHDAMARVTGSTAYQEGEPQAINAFVKVCESLRKLLGLDKPNKVDMTSNGETVGAFNVILPSEREADGRPS